MDQNQVSSDIFDCFLNSIHSDPSYIKSASSINDDRSAHVKCGCIIDTSTPETTAEGFNAWLKGLNECSNHQELKQNRSDTAKNRTVLKNSGNRSRANCCMKSTNLYGRPYHPGRPLSMEDRNHIIELHSSGYKVNAISKRLCISHGCVSKIISRFRETGLLRPARVSGKCWQKFAKSEMIGVPTYSVPNNYVDTMLHQYSNPKCLDSN